MSETNFKTDIYKNNLKNINHTKETIVFLGEETKKEISTKSSTEYHRDIVAECYLSYSGQERHIRIYEINKISDDTISKLMILEKELDILDYSAFERKIKEILPVNKNIYEMFSSFLHINFEDKPEYKYKIMTIIKIIPFLSNYYEIFYSFDQRDESFMMNIYGDGTLKIKVKRKNILDFYYAKKSINGGMISSEGYFKITNKIKNAHFVNKLLRIIR